MDGNMQFLRICAQTIPTIYRGDPIDLPAFLNAINLLKVMAPKDNPNLLVTFIKTKLAGKALDAIPSTAATIDEITIALKQKIKVENSKVVEGKFMALKMDKGSTQDFAKKAEELADCFKR